MRSPSIRLTIVVLCCIAVTASAAFLIDSERQLATRRAAADEFDLHAREASDALGDLRAAQRAYVAAGQGVAFWMPKVDVTLEEVSVTLTTLRQSSAGPLVLVALDDAVASVSEFGNIDRRTREYLASGAQLMAADVIFTEGSELVAAAARHVERARLEERHAVNLSETRRRKQEAIAVGGVALLLLVGLVGMARAARAASRQDAEQAGRLTQQSDRGESSKPDGLVLGLLAEPEDRKDHDARQAGVRLFSTGSLKGAAQLCTELGGLSHPDDLGALMAKAADVLNASGLVLWVGTPTGSELRPTFAHGYSPEMLARLPALPRSADNAAAAAYRTGALQIVLSRPGSSKGAVAAPVLCSEGCVGVLAAEIRDGGEASDMVQALSASLAAQLSGVLTSGPAADGQVAAGGAAL